jgi:hypothetical protein
MFFFSSQSTKADTTEQTGIFFLLFAPGCKIQHLLLTLANKHLAPPQQRVAPSLTFSLRAYFLQQLLQRSRRNCTKHFRRSCRFLVNSRGARTVLWLRAGAAKNGCRQVLWLFRRSLAKIEPYFAITTKNQTLQLLLDTRIMETTYFLRSKL